MRSYDEFVHDGHIHTVCKRKITSGFDQVQMYTPLAYHVVYMRIFFMIIYNTYVCNSVHMNDIYVIRHLTSSLLYANYNFIMTSTI